MSPEHNFTQISEDGLWKVDRAEDALAYLNTPENFRTFSEGLTELMQKYGYTGAADDVDAKTNYVCHALTDIDVPITRHTVRDWFTDKRRPALASNSRSIVYQLCFAFHVAYEDVTWFFGHVYFDRSFNCHTIDESVYYYCFLNGLPYAHARKLISCIDNYPATNMTDVSENIYTNDIRLRLEQYKNDAELLQFFRENKGLFCKWNKTALEYLNRYLELIRGKQSDRALIEAYKKGAAIHRKDVEKCGLIIQEYFHNAAKGWVRKIHDQTISSISFMLDCILTTDEGIHKNMAIPKIVRQNFPSKQTFSDVLKKADTLTSYDAIRKCLILLKFYHFWCTMTLNPELADSLVFDAYRDETNDLLACCGHEELYAGNPYDWLFLWCATDARPLDALRDVMKWVE